LVKNTTLAGSLNAPSFFRPLQISHPNLHFWRPSILPSKCGSHPFYLLFFFPLLSSLLSLGAILLPHAAAAAAPCAARVAAAALLPPPPPPPPGRATNLPPLGARGEVRGGAAPRAVVPRRAAQRCDGAQGVWLWQSATARRAKPVRECTSD
jgi:hypothetical protein